MSDSTTERKPSDEEKIRNLLVGCLFLTLPYLFIWYLVKGGDFVTTYIWYLQMVFYAGGAIGALTAIALAAKKRWPALFENPPELPEWLGFAGAGIAVVVSIVGGFLDGWQTGLLLFWPSVIFAACIIGSVHWLAYQARRWWLNWRT